jgi:branched-chain amino acid transport system permease protein
MSSIDTHQALPAGSSSLMLAGQTQRWKKKRSSQLRRSTLASVVLGAGLFLAMIVPLQPSVRVDMLRVALLALATYLPLMAGQLSLATPGFYLIGGYVAGVFAKQNVVLNDSTGFWNIKIGPLSWVSQRELFPYSALVVEMLLAALVAAVLGAALGFLALRLRGIFLALATIAFNQMVAILMLHDPIFAWFGSKGIKTEGAQGIYGLEDFDPFATKAQYMRAYVPLLVLAAIFLYRLERTRTGRALIAIREDELAASATGIPSTYFKVLVFSLGCVLAAMTGVLSAHLQNAWNPSLGNFELATLVLACVVIGGSRTFAGPIVGAFLLTLLPEALRTLARQFDGSTAQIIEDGRPFVYGLLMVICCIFFPRGLVPPTAMSWLFGRKTGSSTANVEAIDVKLGGVATTSAGPTNSASELAK